MGITDFKDRDFDSKFEAWKAKKNQEKRRLEEAGKNKEQKPITNYIKKEEKKIENEVKIIRDEVKDDLKKVETYIEKETKENPLVVKGLIFLAFAIPVALLLYVLYVNFLPFGYEKTYELTIDENGIISPLSDEVYLTNTQGRKLLSLQEGVQGQVNLVVKPGVVLKNATLNVSIEGEGVYLATPLDINLSEVDWDYNWDFTKGLPSAFQGTAEFDENESCVRFDAYKEQTLFLPNSSDMFEEGPMSIYVKWKPSALSSKLGNGQQIIGHYNWEIYQDSDKVRFNIKSKLEGYEEVTPAATYFFDKNLFFGKEHELLAIYSPSETGYIEFYIDGNYAGKQFIGNEKIWRDYNGNKPLSLGWTDHNYAKNPHFDGCVYNAKITDDVISKENKAKENILYSNKAEIIIPILGEGNLSSIKIELRQ